MLKCTDADELLRGAMRGGAEAPHQARRPGREPA
jgi:hypothetical protein